MTAATQAQTFGDIHVAGQSSLVINQIIQVAAAAIHTRPFIAASPYVGLARFEERHKDFFFDVFWGLQAPKNIAGKGHPRRFLYWHLI